VEQLVAEVQARNPSLQAASAAWRAATHRYPQVVALDDPMFAYMIGPKGVGMDNGGGWMVQASQKIPWAGKRALRGDAASADADAMKGNIGDVRLRLSEAARTAFYDYYLACRETDVNISTHRLVTQFREIAWNKYQVNQTTQQDVLQADVELAALESRRTELTRDEQVAIARINTLLHRAVDHPLPPPPAKTPLPNSLPAAVSLQQAAELRPDLFAMRARIREEQANVALADKEYYPDLNLVAKYDGFMPEDMRPQVGMELNVPLQRGRRSAAVREASERLHQRCAEYQDRLDQVRFEVQSSLNRARQSQQAIRLYEEKILPATQRSVESAQSAYTSGKLDFLRLIDAERQVCSQRDMYYQAIAEYHRRLAELERAVGGSLPETVDRMPGQGPRGRQGEDRPGPRVRAATSTRDPGRAAPEPGMSVPRARVKGAGALLAEVRDSRSRWTPLPLPPRMTSGDYRLTSSKNCGYSENDGQRSSVEIFCRVAIFLL
jgi:outer membrane protein TolC